MKHSAVTHRVWVAIAIAVIVVPALAIAKPTASTKTLQATVNGVPTTATIEGFIHAGDQIFAVAALAEPVAVPSSDQTLQRLMLPVIIEEPVSAEQVDTCHVLTLHVGTLDLNLLGLVVQINGADITLSAERGTLLGNLLCPLADLFNSGDLGGVTAILNRILGGLI